MKKSWLIDSLLGLILAVGVGSAAYFRVPFTETLENRLYDLRLKFAPKAPLSDQILFVAIDDNSIASVGRWPWPRGYVGQIIQQIAAGDPKVIGVNILYVDQDQNQGLETVRQLKQQYQEVLENQKAALSRQQSRQKKKPSNVFEPFESVLDLFSEAEGSLDNDSQLAQVLSETPNVVLPMFFSVDKPLAEESNEALDRMKDFALSQIEASGGPISVVEGYEPLLPLPQFASGASGMGQSNIFKDVDGSVRRETLLIQYRNKYFSSMALEMARVALGLEPGQVKVTLGKEVALGDKRIPLLEDNTMLINYQGPYASLKTVSAVEILADKIQAEAFKDKIVLIGTRATGLGTLFVVPVESNFPDNGVVVTVLQNILGGNFLRRPPWAFQAEMGSLLLVGLFVALILPHLKAKWGALVALVLLAGIGGAGAYVFVKMGFWVKIFYPLALLISAYVAVTLRRFFFTERRKELVEAESIETNKMLGLSFQGQGMLDLAFEKFRKCPIDDAMKELLYNLALDFERKRQFSKASVVYEHISKVDAGYKDIKERQKSTKTAGETMIAGPGLGGGKREGTMVIEGASVKPTLGRYEIEKELGRGAMGIVYLGKDPKINRPVAIKTVRFDDDVDAETAKQVKERFFREAESAGTLNHPNIIRIFDAGEDNEISYIAMELLNGEDLKKYGEKANLLPPEKVLEYVALTADALDYAHSNGVVHRDIKPANIMLLKDGTLRVTDFGIARITASSKTQTGTVMGTPSYMSPEQIAGKKVDGRADLFSLGVMLYEMLAGEKPFDGDSIATLLFRISNEPHPDPRLKYGDRVTAGVKLIIDKALQKDPANRYQRGRDMASDIRECLKNSNAVPAVAGSSAPAAASATAPVVPLPTPPPTPAPVVERTIPPPPAVSTLAPAFEKTAPPAVKPPPPAGDTVKMPDVAPPTDTVRLPASPTDTVRFSPSNETMKLPPSASDTIRMPPKPEAQGPDEPFKKEP